MSKVVATLLTVCLSFSVVSTASAEHHHKEWWKFLKGDWTYEIGEIDLKGTISWRLAAKGNALVGRIEDANGAKAIEIAGYRADTKTVFVNGYGSDGNSWKIEFKKMTSDYLEGPNSGILPDGRAYEGTFVGKKVGEDRYDWTFTGKAGDGEDFKMNGKLTRKSQ